jgi:hypothetical protein
MSLFEARQKTYWPAKSVSFHVLQSTLWFKVSVYFYCFFHLHLNSEMYLTFIIILIYHKSLFYGTVSIPHDLLKGQPSYTWALDVNWLHFPSVFVVQRSSNCLGKQIIQQYYHIFPRITNKILIKTLKKDTSQHT